MNINIKNIELCSWRKSDFRDQIYFRDSVQKTNIYIGFQFNKCPTLYFSSHFKDLKILYQEYYEYKNFQFDSWKDMAQDIDEFLIRMNTINFLI